MKHAWYAVAITAVIFMFVGTAAAQDSDMAESIVKGKNFQTLDVDNDGRLAWDEFNDANSYDDIQKSMSDFQELDRDSSGSISRREWEGEGSILEYDTRSDFN